MSLLTTCARCVVRQLYSLLFSFFFFFFSLSLSSCFTIVLALSLSLPAPLSLTHHRACHFYRVGIDFHWSKSSRLRRIVEKTTVKSTAMDMKGWADYIHPHLGKLAATRRAAKPIAAERVESADADVAARSRTLVEGAAVATAAAVAAPSAVMVARAVASPAELKRGPRIIRDSLSLSACAPADWTDDETATQCEVRYCLCCSLFSRFSSLGVCFLPLYSLSLSLSLSFPPSLSHPHPHLTAPCLSTSCAAMALA